MRWAAAAAVGVLSAAATGQQELGELVRQSERLGVRTGVAVRDLDGRELLFAHRAGEAFAPASNLKLVTAAAVLHGLGAGHRFTTRFVLQGGVLVVQGGGDPNLCGDGDDAPAAVFAAVAKALRARGAAAIAGIELQAGPFTGPERPPTWPQDQLDAWYCPPTGAFVLERGTFVLRLEAHGGGEAAVAIVAPPVELPLRGSIPLVDSRKNAVYGAIDLGSAVRLSGRFWRRSPPVEIRTALREPAAWFEATLRQALRHGGVAIDAAARPADGEVYVHRSPLLPALRRALEDSSNFDAEQLLRVLGAARGDGSFDGGLQAERTALRGLCGNLPAEVALFDGSGLSAPNRLLPAVLVEVLRATLRSPHGKALLDCLPRGGESGTLEDRFENAEVGGRVAAKTGWIRGASALSGVVQRGERLRVFSILMNYDPARGGLNKQLKALQERMVAAIDAMPEAQ